MSGVPYHAWTHRPKAKGGTDPIEIAVSSVAVRVVNAMAQTACGSNACHESCGQHAGTTSITSATNRGRVQFVRRLRYGGEPYRLLDADSTTGIVGGTDCEVRGYASRETGTSNGPGRTSRTACQLFSFIDASFWWIRHVGYVSPRRWDCGQSVRHSAGNSTWRRVWAASHS